MDTATMTAPVIKIIFKRSCLYWLATQNDHDLRAPSGPTN